MPDTNHEQLLHDKELLRAWRKGAVLLGREQWRLFVKSPETQALVAA
jgi:hypothetical protein